MPGAKATGKKADAPAKVDGSGKEELPPSASLEEVTLQVGGTIVQVMLVHE
jgi:hypothetical protein